MDWLQPLELHRWHSVHEAVHGQTMHSVSEPTARPARCVTCHRQQQQQQQQQQSPAANNVN